MVLFICLFLGTTHLVEDELVIRVSNTSAEYLRRGDLTPLLPAGVEIEGVEPLFPGEHRKAGGELLNRCFLLKLAGGEEIRSAALKITPYVDQVEPVAIHTFDLTPNDTYFSNQWYLDQGSYPDIDAPEAWDSITGSDTAVVAVVETGVLYTHADLTANIWQNPDEIPNNLVDDDNNGYVDDTLGWDFVDGSLSYPWWPGEDSLDEDNDPSDFNGHGTHVAGIIGAVGNNGLGVTGVNWDVQIMCLRVGGSVSVGGTETGMLKSSWAAGAIVYAVDEGAAVINCSFETSTSGGMPYAAWYARQSDVLIVKAAGNDNDSTADYYSSLPEILTVAATNSSDGKAYFSDYGSWVDVSAPGTSIYNTISTHYTPGYGYKQGTSMAAPVAAGVAALVKAKKPDWAAKQLYARVYGMVDTIDYLNPGYEEKLGSGRVNLYYAINFDPLFNAQILADTVMISYTYTPKVVNDSLYNHTYYRDRRYNSWTSPYYYIATKLTPLHYPCVLDSVEILFRIVNGAPADSDTVFVWSDNSGTPGSLLRTSIWEIPTSTGKHLKVVPMTPSLQVDSGSFWVGYRRITDGYNDLRWTTDTTGRYPIEDINKYGPDRQSWYTFTYSGTERDFVITGFVKYGGKMGSGYVKNTGNFPLRVSSSETDDTTWIMGWEPRRFEVAPGDSVAINIEVDTTLSQGTHIGNILLYTNDPTDNPFSLPVKYFISSVGVEGYDIYPLSDLKVYPTIGTDIFKIQYTARGDDELAVYDITGRKVWWRKVSTSGRYVWNASKYVTPGIYFVHLRHTKITKKIVVLR